MIAEYKKPHKSVYTCAAFSVHIGFSAIALGLSILNRFFLFS